MKAFANYHPGCAAAVLPRRCCWWRCLPPIPVLQLTLLLGARTVLSACCRKPQRFGRIGFYVPLFLLVAVTNPLFSHNGVTPLFFLNGNPVTLEALLYGVRSWRWLLSALCSGARGTAR